MIATLAAVALVFGELSLLAFGGGNSILPEMQRQAVDVHHWLSAEQFNALFGLAQAAPGPNLMVVTLVGWRVAGLAGALTATVAQFLPSSLLTGLVMRAWDRFRGATWLMAIQKGLVPITAGLLASSAALIVKNAAISVETAAIVGLIALLGSVTKLHPLSLLALGAALGVAAGLV